MYGIPDFEAKIDAIPDSELTPHLSTELGRIPWLQERQEFMPKPFRDQKFVYKGDRLSDLLVGHQERAQAFRNRLMNNFKRISIFYRQKISRIGDRLDDKDIVPTIGLGALAGFISWKSNRTAPVPLKVVFSISGIFLSSLLTHEKLRVSLEEKISSNLNQNIKNQLNYFDEKVGMFGARIWNQGEDLFNELKVKILNKQ